MEAMKKDVDNVEKEVVAGEIDTKDTPARYLGYLARLRPVVQPLSRYLAYTSDVGEAFRPTVNPRLVTGTYLISWTYLVGDVGYEGYKASLRAEKYAPERKMEVVGLGLAKRAIFQSTASMLFPALTIHSVVKYSAKALKKLNVKNVRLRAWGPSALGLSLIPALPYLYDEPVEHVVEKAFDALENKLYSGSEHTNLRRALRAEGHEEV